MDNGGVQTTTEQPDNITDQAKAPTIAAIAHHFLAKRPEYKTCQLKTLKPPWYTDNSNAKYKASEQVA